MNRVALSSICIKDEEIRRNKPNIFPRYVWSTLLYGCETWSLMQTNEMKLRGLEMWMSRRIGRVSWKA